MPTVNVSTTPPRDRPTWVNRCARRSSASAYPLIEPDTSTSSTTRRGRTPRRRQAISPGSPIRRSDARSVREASTWPRCQRWCRAVRRTGGRGRRVANMPASRCFSAADSVATSRCRSTSASLARARTTSSSASASPAPVASASGSPEKPGTAGLRGPRPRQPVAAVEVRRRRPGRSARGRRARRTAWPGRRGTSRAGRRARAAAVAARKPCARSWVTGTPAARSARVKPSRISSPPRGPAWLMARSIWSSACRTRSASSRYFTSAPSVADADGEVDLGGAEVVQRARPVEGLGDARAASAGRRGRAAAGRPTTTWRRSVRGDLRGPRADDLDLALEARVVDPVVEAAPLQRVVQLAGAVGGEHDDRRGRGPHGAELGDRDLVGREHLEQERLELVVGPVDLVDQQHRRALLERLQHRAGEQEARVVQALLGLLDALRRRRRRRPRARAGAGSGAGSPSRRAPAWRRCPRSTAAAPAAGRGDSAIASASAVLPVPGSPSSSSGRCIRSARKVTVASASSHR